MVDGTRILLSKISRGRSPDKRNDLRYQGVVWPPELLEVRAEMNLIDHGWQTVQYAIDSTPRTARLCVILAIISLPAIITAIVICIGR
jgi:hypothetical protein